MAALQADIRVAGETEISREKIGIKMGGRLYGDDSLSLQNLFQQAIPAIFMPIAEQLEARSMLRKLAGEISKQDIFSAYRHDLDLLQQYLREFEETVYNAIRASLIAQKEKDAYPDKQWKELAALVPPPVRGPLIELSSKRAAQGAPELLVALKREFELGITRVLRRMAFWIQLLVEEEFVGLIEWAGDDACAYHYFLHENSAEIVSSERRTEVTEDFKQPFGQRVTYTELEARMMRRRHLLERHTHHIVDARLWELEEFPQRVPERVRLFLNSVPAWLVPHLRIVSGQITMEEKLRRVVSDRTTLETEVVSVWKGSPAVLFGDYALVGWSSEDLAKDNGGAFSRRQKAEQPHRRWHHIKVLACILAVLVGGAGATLGVKRLHNHREAQAESAYALYKKGFSQETVHSAQKGHTLILPGEQPIRYAGSYKAGADHRIRFIWGDTLSPRPEPWKKGWDPSRVQEFTLVKKAEYPYGDIDLAGMGVLATMHVLRATEEEIEYVIAPYQKG